MSVLIRGIEMPKNCFTCRFKNLEICYEGCPLIEVPPHGRLIDADALYEHMVKVHREWVENPEQYNIIPTVDDENMLLYAPTVIEREEVYGEYYDTAGNYHWTGTHSGEHNRKL